MKSEDCAIDTKQRKYYFVKTKMMSFYKKKYQVFMKKTYKDRNKHLFIDCLCVHYHSIGLLEILYETLIHK